MKKALFTGLTVFLMLIGMTTVASATTWDTTTKLDRWLTGVDTTTWEMKMTTDFQIPYDQVNIALLTIYSNFVDGNNDQVTVEDKYFGTLKSETGIFSWFHQEATQFNVASVITDPWPSGSPLKVSLAYNEQSCGWFTNILYLDHADLHLDYTNLTAPVPEPGTMVLLGFGMLGLVVYGKRRMNRDV